jgi:hypothetical protein
VQERLRDVRLTACRPGSRVLSGAAPRPGRLTEGGNIVRYGPGVAAAMAAIRALGREPVPVAWTGTYEPGSSRSNPRGRPVITITKVR